MSKLPFVNYNTLSCSFQNLLWLINEGTESWPLKVCAQV